MTNVREILDRLGRDAVGTALGVTGKSLSAAAVSNRCPSSWWLVLSELCKEQGIECPAKLFTFKPAPVELPDRVAS
ncbi:hypothetical protein [Loktanella sp. M215]|uniref:hypothetical protein n=1 Tax=Loktanella sp. M215 TaxID=2675431 RepID=UPI001F17BEDF|nr:hypothetical protein [Loktanella sp. M215]MCF7700527.1 hypothetical protein [Loktanella sp. M215]